jgi:hypothetical protein
LPEVPRLEKGEALMPAEQELRLLIETAIKDGIVSVSWLTSVVALGAAAIGGAIGAGLASYMRRKMENLATKEDFNDLLEQVKQTTHVTEEIKGQHAQIVARMQQRSSFNDMVLRERYELIKTLNKKLEIARIQIERWWNNDRQNNEHIRNGEILLCTDVYAELELHRELLTEEFYELLFKRNEIASTQYGITKFTARSGKGV